MTAGPAPRTQVVYIGGTGRSGSTMLANVMGEIPGFVSAGEVRFLWQRGVVQDRLCGCGAHIGTCPFWSEVIDRTLAGLGPRRRAAVARSLHREVEARTRLRTLPRHLRDARTEGDSGELDEVLPRLYSAIAAVAGASVVVDSSKLPTYAALLQTLPGIDLRVAHLVRDPRAAAYSWKRRKRQPDLGADAFMERQGTGKSAVLWSVWNRSLERLSRDWPHYTRMTYEEFLADPPTQLRRVLADLDLPRDIDRVFAGPTVVRLSANHTVAGNPNRHQRGLVPLVPDNEWVTEMSASARGAVAGLAWPTLHRYGYRVRS
jgi:hypothetical protein